MQNLRKEAWIFLLLLLLSSFAIGAGEDLEDLWQRSLSSLKKKDYRIATDLLEGWLSKATTQNIVSPEAHYNLAIAHWGTGRKGQAIYQWLESAQYHRNPVQKWKHFSLLKDTQTQLGVQNNTLENFFVLLPFLIHKDFILLLFSLGLWCGALYLLFLPLIRRRYQFLTQAYFLPCFLIGLGSICLGIGYFSIQLGVLESGDTQVSVYRRPQISKATELIALPPGTLVKLANIKGDFVQVLEPISGWVLSSQCLRSHGVGIR